MAKVAPPALVVLLPIIMGCGGASQGISVREFKEAGIVSRVQHAREPFRLEAGGPRSASTASPGHPRPMGGPLSSRTRWRELPRPAGGVSLEQYGGQRNRRRVSIVSSSRERSTVSAITSRGSTRRRGGPAVPSRSTRAGFEGAGFIGGVIVVILYHARRARSSPGDDLVEGEATPICVRSRLQRARVSNISPLHRGCGIAPTARHLEGG